MRSRNEKRKLLAAAKAAGTPSLKAEEFKCPVCGGIASMRCSNGMVRAECHACGLAASERMA